MRWWPAVVLICALAGCSDAPEPDDVVVETVGLGDPIPGLVLEAGGSSIQGRSTTFAFEADLEDANATWSATLSYDGQAKPVADGTGVPGVFAVLFEQAGEHRLSVEVELDGYAVTKASIDLAVAPGDAPPPELPRGAQAPISITNTVTGIPEADLGNVESFDLVSIPEKMTLTFTQGPTALDLDYYLYTPDGIQAGRAAGFEVGTGAEAPIEVTGTKLEQLGTWTIEVIGYAAAEGEYTIDITFE